MPNKNSKAGHIPLRTCVICKKKVDRIQLLSFFTLGEKFVIDVANMLPVRKNYVCRETACKALLNKWLVKHLKRRKNISKSQKKEKI